MKKPLVEVRDLKKTYLHRGNQLPILRGIDLTIYPAEMLSVVGLSGAGKSTFLHMLGTLDRPTDGTIIFNGVDVFTLSDDALARFRNISIGFVFQFHHLLPEFSALENVQMPCLISRLPKQEAQQRAQELLEKVGLRDRMHHRPSELSGGEQQRVALARALVMRPKLLLADEPTGNLDSRTSSGVHELFHELNETLSIAMLIVTHNPNLANVAKRKLQMEDGKIEELFEAPAPAPAASAEPSRPEEQAEPLAAEAPPTETTAQEQDPTQSQP
jgi:lipoprotein-releasing system ATP-binding protein